nr:PREDICTED: putative F-box protein PP2-B12 isoform X1 [Daucus carota subsp. sativus]
MADADLFGKLPEEIIEEVVSLIGPMEACRLSVVCKRFLSAAESNTVWERFLPSDYQQFLDRADSLPNIKFAHKKDVFLFLIGNHVIFDGNTLCFWLHKRSGKKCFLVAASFTGGVEEYFLNPGWCTRSEKSRFQNQITECNNLLLFEIRGKISTCMLSPDTTYAIYLVFHSPIIDEYFNEPVEVSIGIDGVESIKQNVCLNPHKMRSEGDDDLQYPQQRKDDRFEVRLGEYFNRGGEEMNLEITMTKNSEIPKTGPGVEGFEFRPKGS